MLLPLCTLNTEQFFIMAFFNWFKGATIKALLEHKERQCFVSEQAKETFF